MQVRHCVLEGDLLSSELMVVEVCYLKYIDCNSDLFSTYGHRLLKTRLPVRSAKDKPQIG